MDDGIRQRIESLDPVKDHQQIVHLSYVHEFPWDTIKALELALFRTFAVPSIGALLDATGEFVRQTQKRYDDTSILIAEFCHHGYDSERGRQAIRTMNRIHGRFPISQEDYRYVLSTFICEPPRWMKQFGWRPWTSHEVLANFYFWRRVGELMNIRDLPSRYDDFVSFSREFERQHFRYTEAGARVARATRSLFVHRFLPEPLVGLGCAAVDALLDEPLLRAFDFPEPPPLVRTAVEKALGAHALLLRLRPRSHKTLLVQEQVWPTYPNGYEIESVGAADKAVDSSIAP
jgi:hypothetical protein